MNDRQITKQNAAQLLTTLMNENFAKGMSVERAVDNALTTAGITLDASARLHIIREAERNVNAQIVGANGAVEIVADTREFAKVTGMTVDQVERKITKG